MTESRDTLSRAHARTRGTLAGLRKHQDRNLLGSENTARRLTQKAASLPPKKPLSPAPETNRAHARGDRAGEGNGQCHGELWDVEPEVARVLEAWGEEPPFDWLADRPGAVRVWLRAYPGVDLAAEGRKIIAWWFANPAKRKTRRGLKRFLNSWFSRAAERAVRPAVRSEQRRGYSAAEVWGDDDGA